MGVRFFPADAIKDFFFFSVELFFGQAFPCKIFCSLQISLQDIFFCPEITYTLHPHPPQRSNGGLFDWNKRTLLKRVTDIKLQPIKSCNVYARPISYFITLCVIDTLKDFGKKFSQY